MQAHFHSSLPDYQSAGWNFRSARPSLSLRCDSKTHNTTLRSAGGIEQQWTDPLAALDWMATHPGTNPGSRWVGYLSYDLGRLFETLPIIAADDLHLPLFHFSLYSNDKSDGETSGIETNSQAAVFPISDRGSAAKSAHLDRIQRAIGYIRAGDVFQVNLAQRFTIPLAMNPARIWHNLVANTPAAYGACLDLDDHLILSNSPELFLRVTADRRVMTRPVKGTRPLAQGMREELQDSAKDQAELNMIIDLERNDLGRVCQTGSVRVTQPRIIEAHPTVYHGVATIEGQLQLDVTFVDLLAATFPGGSITGAPKIRAMQIIEELEPVRRGPYCGAIGYLAADGSMQFNIAIRTMIIQNNLVHIPVGGGIVADSKPMEEYQETLTKAAAMFRALNLIGST